MRKHYVKRIDRSRRLRCEPLEERRLLSTFTVNSVGDFVDSDPATMSLREAIIAANADSIADRIEFNIPGLGLHTIQLPLSSCRC